MEQLANDPRQRSLLTAEAAPWVRKTFWWLSVIIAFIVFLDIGINYLGWISDETIQDMFNVAREGSLGNWYSSTITAAVGAALWVIYVRVRSNPAWLGGRRGWAVLAFLFFYLSIDDGIRFHEEVAGAIQDYLVGTTEEGSIPSAAMGPIGRLLEANPSYPWLILFAPIIGALGLYMVWFLWRNLDPRAVKRVALAVVCFFFAEAQDFVEGIDGSYDGITERFHLSSYTAPHFGKVFEESLEMLGMTILFCVFLGVIAKLAAEARGVPARSASDLADEVSSGSPLEG